MSKTLSLIKLSMKKCAFCCFLSHMYITIHGSNTLSLKTSIHVKYGEIDITKPVVPVTVLRTHLKINGRVA